MINFLQNEREKIMEKQKKNKFNRRKLINSMALAGITFPIIGRENASAQDTNSAMRSNALLGPLLGRRLLQNMELYVIKLLI